MRHSNWNNRYGFRYCEGDEKIAKLKSELESNEENLAQALECKADTEKLKDDLRKSTERIALQKYEKEQVRKELDVERHEHGMTK